MEFESHVGELAELYAAGALDARERSMVEAHIARCAHCLRRIGEAEETILALERRFKVPDDAVAMQLPLVLRRSPTRLWYAAALVAALIIGFLMPHPQAQSPATLAMVQSHFSHAQFGGSGPAAKVLYARDRSWFYVIVEGAHRYDLYGARNGGTEFLGSTQPVDSTSDLFVRPLQRFDAVELRENGRTVEKATIR